MWNHGRLESKFLCVSISSNHLQHTWILQPCSALNICHCQYSNCALVEPEPDQLHHACNHNYSNNVLSSASVVQRAGSMDAGMSLEFSVGSVSIIKMLLSSTAEEGW